MYDPSRQLGFGNPRVWFGFGGPCFCMQHVQCVLRGMCSARVSLSEHFLRFSTAMVAISEQSAIELLQCSANVLRLLATH